MGENMGIPDISGKKILLVGQVITSRTETLEEYLKVKVDTLAVIGLTSAFSNKNYSRCTLYEKGRKSIEFSLPSFQIGVSKAMYPFLFITFLFYCFSISYALLHLKKKFDIFIGVACFSAFFGTFLKRSGVFKKLIYYCIDYYPPPPKKGINTLNVAIFRLLDKTCLKYADVTWHISPRIEEARERFSRINRDSYRHLVFPLTYAANLQRFVTIDKIDRFSIGFIGSLSPNQGLQLLVEIIPDLIKEIPQIRVQVIGRGIYENELKSLIKNKNLEDYFVFHGFIKDENEALDILSKCAFGIAPWDCTKEDNILYADPGKPKLYAFCGLPIIMTNGTPIAREIQERKAGISINYEEKELREAVLALLKDSERLNTYKMNAAEFARQYTTETVLDSILQQSLENNA